MTETIQKSKSEGRAWRWFAVLLVTAILLGAIHWVRQHPYGIHSDEAFYINEAQIDLQLFHVGGLVHLVRWVLHSDGSRPPAYRLIVFPFVALFGYHTTLVRLVTLACFAISAWFIYLTTKRLAGPTAGAIAALVFCLSPDILAGSIFFSTEGPLYLAVAATLYFLSFYWSDAKEPSLNWLGLGLALGLGLLSKTTFPFIAGPVFLFSLFTIYRYRRGLPGWGSMVKAGALGFVVAAPWWFKNFRPAFAYAMFTSRGFLPRYTLGPHSSLSTWTRWISSVFEAFIGPGASIVILLLIVAYFTRAIARTNGRLSAVQRTALFACACTGLPLVLAQLFGTDYLLRHISAAGIPLAISVGVLAGAAGWVRSRAAMAISGLLFFAQVVMLFFPLVFPNQHPVDPGLLNGFPPWRVMIRFEQWDWQPLRELSDSCGIPTPGVSDVGNGRVFNGQTENSWSNPIGSPKISFLGNGRAFNGSQIQYPWIDQRVPAPDLTWLWRYEDGQIDWQHVMNSAAQSDIVVTAPNYIGQATDKNDVDNQNNVEFARRLSEDPRFQGPFRFTMGNLDPVEVDAFVKKSLSCHR
jgi:4-amino-4-deoxy-L-arabinose transferase-like glycosyltransferase